MEGELCDLRTQEQIHLKVVEAYPDATIVIDRNGRIIVFNNSAELMFDYHREDVVGKPVETLIPKESAEKHKGYRDEYFEDPRVREMGLAGQLLGHPLRGVRKDGSVFPVAVKLAPVVVQGSGVFFLAVVRRVKKEDPK